MQRYQSLWSVSCRETQPWCHSGQSEGENEPGDASYGVHLQGAGGGGAGLREDQHHQEICPPVLLGALQGNHRGGLRSEGKAG